MKLYFSNISVTTLVIKNITVEQDRKFQLKGDIDCNS